MSWIDLFERWKIDTAPALEALSKVEAIQEELVELGRRRSVLLGPDGELGPRRFELSEVEDELEEADAESKPGLLSRRDALHAACAGPVKAVRECEKALTSERLEAYQRECSLLNNGACEIMRRAQQKFQDRATRRCHAIERYGIAEDRELRGLAEEFQRASDFQAGLGGELEGSSQVPLFRLKLSDGLSEELKRALERSVAAA